MTESGLVRVKDKCYDKLESNYGFKQGVGVKLLPICESKDEKDCLLYLCVDDQTHIALLFATLGEPEVITHDINMGGVVEKFVDMSIFEEVNELKGGSNEWLR